ncbi:ParB/RepB/Spo0J family partition protein [Traorella massiliensis]|uniref:ParB/RepB/Spo0J family partition protein n=1 Tax=Traorella massiliensis TaxID=1903263 RepID=UPI0008F97737|nr:ParB/RepB/Spo0J family partition protein [Traorella massiliensis]
MKEILMVPIEKIVANPYQPRIEFNEESLMDLAQSIRENGLIQPVTLKEKDGYYEIVAGERRYRACQMIGMTEIPANVMDVQESQMAALALVENIQREDLSAIEEAKAFVQIMKVTGCTQSELAMKLGKSQSSIANKIRLLNLSENVQNAVSSKIITERHARSLVGMDEKKQQEMLDKIVKKGLNVSQTENLIKQEKKDKVKLKGFTREIKIALNTVRQAYAMIQRAGIKAKLSEYEDEDGYTMTIHFPKE